MKNILALFIIVVACSVIPNALDGEPISEARLIAKAADLLRREYIIRTSVVSGFQAPRPTEQGWAISIVMQKAKNPAETFADIANTGSYPALLALYVLDKARFQLLVTNFRGAEKVIVVTGDELEEMSGEDFVREFLPQRGAVAFQRLQFKEIPDLVDTVRGDPRP